MFSFVLRRTMRSLFTLWLVVSVVFLVFRLIGDPLTVLVPEDAPQQIRDFYAQKWGLDASVPEQYLRYFASIAQGNLGQSFISGRDVTSIIGQELPNTLLLGISAFVLALAVGVTLGIVAALNRNGRLDRAVMLVSVMGFSMPNYFLGILLILIFSVQLGLLPTSGNDTWQHLLLPLITLSTATAARLARFTRSAVLEVLSEPYLRTARAKGLRRRTILYRHTLRNASIPVVTVLGIQLGYLVGGSAVVESVFGWPGIGRLLVQAVSFRDLSVVQALVLLISASVVLANLLVDIAYGLLDPRISVTG